MEFIDEKEVVYGLAQTERIVQAYATSHSF